MWWAYGMYKKMTYKRRFIEDDIMAQKEVEEKMKRCFNCGNLIAKNDRDVCLKCLKETLLQDKKVKIKLEEQK